MPLSLDSIHNAVILAQTDTTIGLLSKDFRIINQKRVQISTNRF